MVKQFETDPSRKKNLREIPETETSKPKKTFNIDEFAPTVQKPISSSEKKVGRPKKEQSLRNRKNPKV